MVGQLVSSVLKDCSAFCFRDKQSKVNAKLQGKLTESQSILYSCGLVVHNTWLVNVLRILLVFKLLKISAFLG